MVANRVLVRRLLSSAWLVMSLVAGCARHEAVSDAQAIAQNEHRIATELFVRTELFFGTSRPDGTAVSEEQWRQFVDAEITPRFPEGLTILTGAGQFRQANGVIAREPSVLLILLYPLKSWR